ncbi:hypothetical protein H1R20_g3000, partial [Candolleomyces eurysporus]
MATLLHGIQYLLLALLVLPNLGTLIAAAKTFKIVSGYPSAITTYVNRESRESVASGATIVNTAADNWMGFINSKENAPGGNTGTGTFKAGFLKKMTTPLISFSSVASDYTVEGEISKSRVGQKVIDDGLENGPTANFYNFRFPSKLKVG